MGYQGIGWLERPEREKEEHTATLLKNMNIGSQDAIADIGAGSGYHVFKMAKIAAQEEEYEYYEEEIPHTVATHKEPFHLDQAQKVLIEQIVLHPLLLEHPMLADVLDLMVENEVKRLIKWIQTLYFEIDEDEYQSVLSQKISQSGFEKELVSAVNSSLFNF